MKYLFFLAVILFIATTTQAQKYVPFPKHGAVWGLDNWDDDGTHEVTHYTYYINQKGDTTIDGLNYQLIFNANMMVNTAIREDSSKHIYLYDFKLKKDTLLYDFNLKLNDTLPNTYINFQGSDKDTNYVASIDSVLLGGQYHKRYGICNTSFNFKPYVFLIEGIGSTYGLVSNLVPVIAHGTKLSCFSIDSISIYPDANSNCYNKIASVSENHKPNPQFKIFPNPTSGKFTIQTQSIFDEGNICVRDVLGRILLQEKLQSPNQTLNISDQPKGLYFIDIKIGNQSATQKLILQ